MTADGFIVFVGVRTSPPATDEAHQLEFCKPRKLQLAFEHGYLGFVAVYNIHFATVIMVAFLFYNSYLRLQTPTLLAIALKH